MYQNSYNYYPQTQLPQRYGSYMNQAPQTTFSSLKGRPVSSLEEARAMSIDFDGSIFYFPDPSNKRIYTKQINMDGTASLLMYEMKELPQPTEITDVEYVTKQEFENVISQFKQMLTVQSTPEVVPEEPKEAPKLNLNF